MTKEADIRNELFCSIIDMVRTRHADTIDKAYKYFWDEQDPEEFLSGTAYTLGFHNFEDWLVCDYPANEAKETFIDIYLRENEDVSGEGRDLLGRMRASVMSLYEVSSVSKGKRVIVKDLLLGGEHALRDRKLSEGLTTGDIFATRLLELDGKTAMAACVFPYPAAEKKKILKYIDRQFGRYVRNVKPGGSMRDYLKDYGDVFNLIWIHLLLNPDELTI
ncbi:MAG: hypothetical protein OHK006_23010 [Thermodesulfovibrionales bacterium]